MSKYNEVMEKVKVSKDMRDRILSGVEKELEKGADSTVSIEEITGKKKEFSKINEFRKYAGIAAAFAVLVVGAYAVSKVQPFGAKMESSTMMVEEASVPRPNVSDNAMATESMAEEVTEEAAYEEAAYEEISPDAMDADAAFKTETTTAGAKAEADSAGKASNSMSLAKYKEYASLAKLSKAAGTSFKEIEYLDSFSSGKDYYLYDGNVAAISYDVEGNTVIVREMDAKLGDSIPTNVGASTADLVSDSITVGDVTVNLFGDEDSFDSALGSQLFYIAEWTREGLVYQIESSEAITYEDMKELMELIVE